MSNLRKYVFVFCLALVAGCSQSTAYSGSYVGGDDSALFQLNIVEGENSQLTGGLAISTLDYKHGKVQTQNIGLTGVRDGKNLSLLPTNGNGGALFLEASGDNLFLKVPNTGQSLELAQYSQEEYQQRLAGFYEALNANDVGLIPDE